MPQGGGPGPGPWVQAGVALGGGTLGGPERAWPSGGFQVGQAEARWVLALAQGVAVDGAAGAAQEACSGAHRGEQADLARKAPWVDLGRRAWHRQRMVPWADLYQWT